MWNVIFLYLSQTQSTQCLTKPIKDWLRLDSTEIEMLVLPKANPPQLCQEWSHGTEPEVNLEHCWLLPQSYTPYPNKYILATYGVNQYVSVNHFKVIEAPFLSSCSKHRYKVHHFYILSYGFEITQTNVDFLMELLVILWSFFIRCFSSSLLIGELQ